MYVAVDDYGGVQPIHAIHVYNFSSGDVISTNGWGLGRRITVKTCLHVGKTVYILGPH